jgi:CRISPR-associated protein Cas6
MDEAPAATMVDIAFALQGDALPRDHRRSLADAVDRALPWLAGVPDAGVHRLNVSAGGGPQCLLSRRTRLTLRLPRSSAEMAASMQGARLEVADAALGVGAAHVRELLPWSTLYAHFVASDEDDEGAFLRWVETELAALGVAGRAICGRAQTVEAGALRGFSLMLDGLAAPDAARLLDRGVGRHRRLGCGLFVPHRSAAAMTLTTSSPKSGSSR